MSPASPGALLLSAIDLLLSAIDHPDLSQCAGCGFQSGHLRCVDPDGPDVRIPDRCVDVPADSGAKYLRCDTRTTDNDAIGC